MLQSYTGSRRYTGPITKKARYLNFPLLLEGKIGKPSKRLADGLNNKSKKRRKRAKSSFAEENDQIQKVCYLYGLKKKQLRNYFVKTKDKRGLKEYNLYLHLESRLDNILFLAGFGTRRFARQIISHGHVVLNGKETNIPSQQLRVDDFIELKKEIYDNKILKSFIERKQNIPSFLELEKRKITLKRLPFYEEIAKKEIDMLLVIRRYSREV